MTKTAGSTSTGQPAAGNKAPAKKAPAKKAPAKKAPAKKKAPAAKKPKATKQDRKPVSVRAKGDRFCRAGLCFGRAATILTDYSDEQLEAWQAEGNLIVEEA